MSRSKWKGPYLEKSILSHKRSQKNTSKNSEVVPRFIGFEFFIYNGKNFSKLLVNENMIGHKFGEFVLTRKKFSFKESNK